MESAVCGLVGPAYIEVDDLNDVAMFGLDAGFHLVEESFDDFLSFAPAPLLPHSFVEDLYGDALVGGHVYSHFDSEFDGRYLL